MNRNVLPKGILRAARIFLVAGFLCLPAAAQREYPIAAIQGSRNISTLENQFVRASGVVTARLRNGFFIQTPDGQTDNDPKTSEGIFVFTRAEPPPDAVPGNAVTVSGRVTEFRPGNVLATLTITEISYTQGRDFFAVTAKSVALPKPVVLSPDDFKPNSVDQLEKYEGMRVAVTTMSVVAATGGRVDAKTETVESDGTFFGVLKGFPRPFREPGLEPLFFLTSPDREKWKKDFPKIPIFDGNQELIRVDTRSQISSTPMNVMAGQELKDVTGVLHYGFGRYTILTDAGAPPAVAGGIRPLPLPPPTERQFSIAAMNIETFVDDEDDPNIREDVATKEAFEKRVKKVSRAINELASRPDIIAVVEAENLNVLRQLAKAVNAGAVAAGLPDPKYEAFLEEGNDGRSIDVGFLVKGSRVTVRSAKQLGKNERFSEPGGRGDAILHDRPPFVIEAEIRDEKTGTPFRLTVMSNHLKSLRGITDERDGPRVRAKRALQAEYIAKWVNERQKADPNERIVIAGDLNAFQFNDGLVDIIGTLTGKPTPKDAVLASSPDLIERDLINLVDLIQAAQKYSYVFDGSAQSLDHIIINEPMRKHLNGFGYLRVNADFPKAFRADGERIEGFSDHDVAVAYFTLDQ
ncbi:MAG TPA: hypothetical protein PKE66_02640 [Pyrinomonadaceae bacterium]|nr:hypothetical protein [Pyrinomonadaceae bacterium]